MAKTYEGRGVPPCKGAGFRSGKKQIFAEVKAISPAQRQPA